MNKLKELLKNLWYVDGRLGLPKQESVCQECRNKNNGEPPWLCLVSC